MTRVLVTGMSGAGKSTVIAALFGRQSTSALSPGFVAVVMMSMTFSFTQIGAISPSGNPR